MDGEIYPLKKVGDYYRQHFICVKSQMDETKNDSKQMQEWYPTADLLDKKYSVRVYPTYLFFSSEGTLINRESGFKSADNFVTMGERSIDNNATHFYVQYYALLIKYEKGIKDYNIMPALIDTAKMLRQRDVVAALVKDYKRHLSEMADDSLFTRKNISFIASYDLNSTDMHFGMFYPDGEHVNKVMGDSGFAQRIVDKIVLKEEIAPVVKTYDEIQFVDGKRKVGLPDPDWNQLFKNITEKYNADIANRTILLAKIQWYQDQHEWAECAESLTTLMRNCNMNINDEDMDDGLNEFIWSAIFLRSVDKEQINEAIKCMKGIVDRAILKGTYLGSVMDTYANLLYKAGKNDQAIEMEADDIKLLINSKADNSTVRKFEATLDKMKNGMPTWPRYIDKDDFFGSHWI